MSRDDLVTEGPLGRIVLTGAALASTVVEAVHTVDGARVRRPRRGVSVDVAGDDLHVSLRLTAAPTLPLPALGLDVQRAVSSALGRATGRSVTVDVVVEELNG